MATNQILCHAPPEEVFAVLEDPRPYAYFVVGTRRIRRFDPHWPQPGSRFHHSLGLLVTVIRDATEVLESDPPNLLVVRAMLRPLAVTRTSFRLERHPKGTLLHVEEFPISGPAARPRIAPLVDRLLWARNLLLVRRLRNVVARRRSARGGAVPSTAGEE